MSRNPYEQSELIRRKIEGGDHRGVIGGLWEQIGQLQLDYLIANGLLPQHQLLDVGCGSLRCGVKVVPYLEAGNYFGLDLRRELLDAGYEREVVPAGLGPRLPRTNLIDNPDFDARSFGVRFDYAIALSVFTHITWNDIRLCFDALSDVMLPGSVFLTTFFPMLDDARASLPITHQPGGTTTKGDRDPYHYRASDIEQASRGLSWRMERHGPWGHPRGQHVAHFRFDG